MKTIIFFKFYFFCCLLIIITSCGNGNNKTTNDSSYTKKDSSKGKDKFSHDKGKGGRETPYNEIKELNARYEYGIGSIEHKKVIKKTRKEVDALLKDTTGYIYAIISSKNNVLDVKLDTVFNGKSDSVAFAKKKFPFSLHDFPLAIKMEKSELFRLQDSNSRHFTLSVLLSGKDNDSPNPCHTGGGKDSPPTNKPGDETWPKENFIWISGKLTCH